MKTPQRKTKLTPLGKLIALVICLTLGAIAGATGATATRPHAQAWRCITVAPGETLWDLAGRQERRDRREVVHQMIEHNRLYTGAARAGDAIWIPNEGDLTGLVEADSAACPPAH